MSLFFALTLICLPLFAAIADTLYAAKFTEYLNKLTGLETKPTI